MKMDSITLWLTLGMVSLCMQGCVSYSQPFIGPTGDIEICASSSQDQGFSGIVAASYRFNSCVKNMKAHGYKKLETVGIIGLLFYPKDASGFRIKKVYANSPAEKAGVVRGDILSAIDGHKVTDSHELTMLQGAPGSTVTITVIRNGALDSYKLTRAVCFYNRMLGDIAFEPAERR